jgi:hypothetical protein
MLSRGMNLGVENPGGPQKHPADGRKANENEEPGSHFAHQSQQRSQSVIHRLHHFVVNKFRSDSEIRASHRISSCSYSYSMAVEPTAIPIVDRSGSRNRFEYEKQHKQNSAPKSPPVLS